MRTRHLRSLTTLFLQQTCPLCDRSTAADLCGNCWRQLQSCATVQPASPMADALPILSWGRYQGSLKRAISALKYDGHPQIAKPLGLAAGHLWQTYPIPTRRSPLVVPIPLHPDKLQERGFNQAERLAIAFCDQTDLKLCRNGLIRQRATVPQFGLGLNERHRNLSGAFTISAHWQRQRPNRPVLLLDDIYTTGATVRTAAAELRRWGISVCGVVAIARAFLD